MTFEKWFFYIGIPWGLFVFVNMSEIKTAWETSGYGLSYTPYYWGFDFLFGYYIAGLFAWVCFECKGRISEHEHNE